MGTNPLVQGLGSQTDLRSLRELSGLKPRSVLRNFWRIDCAIEMRSGSNERDRDPSFFGRFNSPRENLLFIWSGPVY